jgi:uncharacterized protein (TIGR00369 family)
MEKQPNSRTCFLCGRQNDYSLKMSWYNDTAAGRIRSTVTIPEQFNGYPGIAHGGIVAAILDETAGRAILLDGGDQDLMVTLKLEVRYRKATPTGQPLTVQGWVLRRTDTRAQVAAEIRLADGSVSAECEAVCIRPPEDFRQRWEAERPYWKVYPE